MKIAYNPLIKKMGNLAPGLTPKSLHLKAKVEQSLKDNGFGAVRAAKIAKGLQGGYNPAALSKREAVATMRALGKGGIFKHAPKNVLGKVNSFIKDETQAKKDQTNNNEIKTKRIKAQRRMDQIMADSKKQPEQQSIKNSTPIYARPAFAKTPLPINHEHDNTPDAPLNPFSPALAKNNNYEIYQPPVQNKAEEEMPQDMPGLD